MIITLTPNPSWKVHDFPLNSGDSWTTNTNIDYSGGFTYDAGSLGGTGLLVALLVTPPQVTLVPLLRVYHLLGLTGTIPGIWLYQVGFTVPFGVFLLRGFISGIPSELFESAAIDGASQLRIAWSISSAGTL